MVEYLEDVIDKHPEEAFVVREGEAIQIKTGDEWFDSMEEKIARGEPITLEQLGVPKEEADRLRARAPQHQPLVEETQEPDEPEDFSETY